ncbi:hypothetical protein B0H99_104191 [Planomicrobium soli]|uniref:Uncharacterized protein n=1 Tax=Planomicrobium soli TaxID=1176648 RepID=A0A2P8H3E6_9BACL|nr:hypothetical protein [Planomicrobium soli]PSL40729.1 hypothetical protein B0H99_104191 [Planomicrobium soli]
MDPISHRNSIHISVDDVIEMLRELEQRKYGSVWDHPAFSFFRQLHEQYGAVFSLYCFYSRNDGRWNLDRMPEHFKGEFEQSSGWLRFGFHSYGYETKYCLSNESLSAKEALDHYSIITDAICRFAGVQALDSVPRIHFYYGTREKIRVWRDAKHGITGLLTADDSRDEVYYLDGCQREQLLEKERYFDADEKLFFIKTNLRLENEPAPVLKLEARKNAFHDREHSQCIFTHENQLDSPEIKKKIMDCCEWANVNGYKFGFPMDALPDCRKGDANADTSRNSKIPGSPTGS